MEIPREVFNTVQKAIDLFKSEENIELEIKYDSEVKRDNFTNGLHYFIAQGLKPYETTTLDVLFVKDKVTYRVTIEGVENIQKYCVSNKLDANIIKQILNKRNVPGYKGIILPEFNLKVNVRNEQEVDIADDILDHGNKALKAFRYKKRFSIVPKDSHIRYDFTIVKSSSQDKDSFFSCTRMTDVISNQESYEIEIEMLKPGYENAATFLKKGIELLGIINGNSIIIPKTEQRRVVMSYLELWWKDQNPDKELTLTYEYIKNPKFAKRYFIGPQPVTIELSNVVQDGVVDTIIKDYTVTEKADGERFILYIDGDGKCYFINNKLDIYPTGVEVKDSQSCIIDGEYITRDVNGKPVKAYAMFDVYYHNGESVLSLPLISEEELEVSRLSILKTLQDELKPLFEKKRFVLFVKKFLHSDIFENSKYLLDMEKTDAFLYRIDGLIYTPKYLPVGSVHKKGKPNANGSWHKLLKWKPPAENTMDFQVKLNSSPYTIVNGNKMKVFNLYVGYRKAEWEPITASVYFQKKYKRSRDTTYGIRPFKPSDVFNDSISTYYGTLQDDNVFCKNGDQIYDQSIVEFAYTNDETIPYPLRWVPLRVRKDKTTPNDLKTVMNIWRSISLPVTTAIITGEKKIFSSELPEEGIYYKRSISRDKYASKNMMDFHNYWAKNKMLINKYGKNKESLLDFGCGKGGDLMKWIDANIKTVYGLDKFRDNIENPEDGAYARMIDIHTNPKTKNLLVGKKYSFATMDTSEVIDEKKVATVTNDDDKMITTNLLKHAQFDIISCQFAIHYFFQTEQTLDNFVQNVNRFLKPGGFFVGTCLDGIQVKKALKGKSIVTGEQNDRILWNIRKSYDNENDTIKYGEQVKIYMESIGLEIPEYLVNFSLLIEKFSKYNIIPVERRSFEEVYYEILYKPENKENEYYYNVVKNMSDVEKTYSFMNTLFAFEKK